jgi:hypothetical protein
MVCTICTASFGMQTFRIKSLRSTRDGNKSAYDIVCHLINQRGKVCFRAEKVELTTIQLLYLFVVQ